MKRRFYSPARTFLLAGILALCAAPAIAKPYETVASASDSDQYFADASLSRTVKHPQKLRVAISADTTAALDFSYYVTCYRGRFELDSQSGGATVYGGQVVKLPTIYAKPKRCRVNVDLQYDNLATEDPAPPTVTIGLELRAKPQR